MDDFTPRPRDLIDTIEAIAAKNGDVEVIDEDYYQAFIELDAEDMKRLVIMLMLSHDREVRRLAEGSADAGAIARITRFISSTLVPVSQGLLRCDAFGRLHFTSRIGPKASDLGLDEELSTRCSELAPIVESTVRRTLPWLLSREMSQDELGL